TLPKGMAVPCSLVLTYSVPSSGGGTTTYAIVATAGEHGKITPSGAVSVDAGASKRFEIAADEGYDVDRVTVDDKPIELDEAGGYTFEKVDKAHAIHATFVKEKAPETELALDELALVKGKKLKLKNLNGLTGTWAVADASVASIGKKGVLKAKKLGDTQLTFAVTTAVKGATFLDQPVAAGDNLVIKLHVV
ncbi:MAG: hypothetical protein RSD95_17510, partial [Clostridia bacterium]